MNDCQLLNSCYFRSKKTTTTTTTKNQTKLSTTSDEELHDQTLQFKNMVDSKIKYHVHTKGNVSLIQKNIRFGQNASMVTEEVSYPKSPQFFRSFEDQDVEKYLKRLLVID